MKPRLGSSAATGWGRDNPVFRHLFTQMFMPSARREQMAWFDELHRIAVSPDSAARLNKVFGNIDVAHLLFHLAVWAGDIAAIIAELDLDEPVLFGWSYGGVIVYDYLRAHGEGNRRRQSRPLRR